MENRERSVSMDRCPHCMREIDANPCPYCGFDAQKTQQPDYALPYRTILRGRYLVGAMLGQGGFGITYAGWDLALEVRVAVKEYYPAGQVSRNSGLSRSVVWSAAARTQELREAGMESFLREARKMARIDDIPEIVRVRDTFYENDTAYIVMDFVQGETLTAKLKREGPLPFAQAMKLLRPAITAMGQVHEAGVIHRDLSPDNIMIDPRGRVHILDLGAAKDLTANHGASSMLVARSGFSPIEQYSQRGGSGPWTDVYAMAATLYHTLTGVLPPASVDRINGAELRWDLPQLAALPAGVRAALQKALAMPVNDRTQSMAALLEGLEGGAAQEQPAVVPAVQGPSPTQAPDGAGTGRQVPSPTQPAEEQGAAAQSGTPEYTPVQPAQKKKAKKLLIPAVCAAVCLVLAVGLMIGLKGSPPDEPEPKEVAHGTCGDNVVWTLLDDGALTVSGSGPMADYSKPDDPAPWNDRRDMIRTVTVRDGVTTIGRYAFEHCSNLAAVTIADSVTRIGHNAFYFCQSLSEVNIPDSVTEIGYASFYFCRSLSAVTIPDSVTEIGNYTFYHCTGLASVVIPDGVTKINCSAFEGCTSLGSVTLPDSVTRIDANAFSDCASLTDVYFGGTDRQWENIRNNASAANGFLFSATVHYAK